MPDISGLGCDSSAMASDALGDVLGQVADALQVAGDAQRGHDVAQVVGHRLAARDHGDHLLLDLALELVDLAVAHHDLLGELRVAALQRIERLAEQLLGEAAHLRDLLVEQRQLFLVRFYGVLVHGFSLRAWAAERNREAYHQPKRPVM